MTDSTDKKSKKISDQDNQHESLHHRLNSIDKKVKEKNDNFDVDLDAMLDKAESSFASSDQFQDDEDAIDKLLMNADDALLQAETDKDVNIMKDHDELDNFLSFDDFGEDFNEPEKAQTARAESESSLAIPSNEAQDDEDDLDRLVMNTALDTDYTAGQARQKGSETLEELDSFSGFSDFDEPTQVDAAPRDELDEFLSLIDDFDESDMIPDDEVDTSIPAEAKLVEPLEEPDEEEDDELDKFSDFSDFNEPDIIPAVEEVVESDQYTKDLSSSIDDADLSAEDNDFFRFDESGDSFAESDLTQKDKEDEPSILAAPDLNAPTEDEILAEEKDVDAIEELDGFSDFSDFNEPEIAPAVEIEESEQVTDSLINEGSPAEEFDEFADFDGFGEDFDESDMIQDDDVEDSANLVEPDKTQDVVIEQSFDDKNTGDGLSLDDGLDELDALQQTTGIVDEADEFDESDLIQDDEVDALANLVAADEELPVTVEESVNDAQDDEDSFNSLFADADFDEEDMLEQASGKDDVLIDDASLPDEADDFSGFGDDFNESDLIQDDEIDALTDTVAANEELPLAAENLVNDVQDDEDSFNSLFADADFGEEDVLEQAEGKKDEFGDDASLSEIDSFFQLTEDNDDFSVQAQDGQLAGEKSLIQDEQEDDFLLPDFDITADTEISDTLVDTEIKESEFSDAFGDTDFLGGDEVVPTSSPEASELKSGGSEAIVEPTPKSAVDTAIDNVENVKLSPFDFELDDLKKQLEDSESKVKKAKRYSYAAMGFGAVALSAAAGLGMMTYGAKTEVSRLTEAVATLEANLAKSAANSPSEEIDAMRNSVVSLNKQVDGFITELKENSQFPSDLLNNKVPSIVAKQDMVSKALDMLQVKVGNLEEKASLTPSVPSIVEPPKVEAAPEPASEPVKEENVHEIAPAKVVPEHEQAKSVGKHDEPHDVKAESTHEHAKEVASHEPASAKKEVVHEQASGKEKPASEIAPVKLKPQPEVVVAKPIVSAKPVVEEKPVKISKPAVIGKWGVNLVAFKQEWFAKSKAAEFARLGVFAEVIPVHEKGATMYRLRVGGFKSKAEASSNTAKIKQMLNLDSVWVSDN